MSDSICTFLPIKNYNVNLKTVHFVYEAEYTTLKQPFLRPIHYLHLATQGTAILKIHNKSYDLKKGSLFLVYPGTPYEIIGSDDFKYTYISFTGSSVSILLEELQLTPDTPVFENHEHLIDLWLTSLSRINPANANILSQGILLYTFSFICSTQKEPASKHDADTLFESIVDYVDNNFQNPELSLKLLATIFSYTEKYISKLFKQNMNVNFNSYLNTLRICHAQALIGKNVTSITHLAYLCGYSDPQYFSKVFRKLNEKTPTEYIQYIQSQNSFDA